jgi:hypothetical protein
MRPNVWPPLGSISASHRWAETPTASPRLGSGVLRHYEISFRHISVLCPDPC